MHELTLCRQIVDIVLDKLSPSVIVKEINLEVGQLAGVDAQALLFGFDVVAKETLLSNAQLNIIEIPGQASCGNCGNCFALSNRYDPCVQCGGHSLSIIAGEELVIKSMEVEPCAESADVIQGK